MRDMLRKKDFTIMSYTQKDLTLQIMNIKVEEINAFFLQLLKKLTLQHDKEKEVYKRQFANVGETIKDSIMNDPNLARRLKPNTIDKSNLFLASQPHFPDSFHGRPSAPYYKGLHSQCHRFRPPNPCISTSKSPKIVDHQTTVINTSII